MFDANGVQIPDDQGVGNAIANAFGDQNVQQLPQVNTSSTNAAPISAPTPAAPTPTIVTPDQPIPTAPTAPFNPWTMPANRNPLLAGIPQPKSAADFLPPGYHSGPSGSNLALSFGPGDFASKVAGLQNADTAQNSNFVGAMKNYYEAAQEPYKLGLLAANTQAQRELGMMKFGQEISKQNQELYQHLSPIGGARDAFAATVAKVGIGNPNFAAELFQEMKARGVGNDDISKVVEAQKNQAQTAEANAQATIGIPAAAAEHNAMTRLGIPAAAYAHTQQGNLTGAELAAGVPQAHAAEMNASANRPHVVATPDGDLGIADGRGNVTVQSSLPGSLPTRIFGNGAPAPVFNVSPTAAPAFTSPPPPALVNSPPASPPSSSSPSSLASPSPASGNGGFSAPGTAPAAKGTPTTPPMMASPPNGATITQPTTNAQATPSQSVDTAATSGAPITLSVDGARPNTVIGPRALTGAYGQPYNPLSDRTNPELTKQNLEQHEAILKAGNAGQTAQQIYDYMEKALANAGQMPVGASSIGNILKSALGPATLNSIGKTLGYGDNVSDRLTNADIANKFGSELMLNLATTTKGLNSRVAVGTETNILRALPEIGKDPAANAVVLDYLREIGTSSKEAKAYQDNLNNGYIGPASPFRDVASWSNAWLQNYYHPKPVGNDGPSNLPNGWSYIDPTGKYRIKGG